MKTRLFDSCPVVLVVSSLLLSSPLSAASEPASNQKEEAVELSPFIVSTQSEKGYAATNTQDGSRLNTPLRDTPGAISVFTKDFLDDLGATTM
jgi:outer membrane receptor for ferric coprogen and ferric-rhodotorulic acid